MNRRSGHPSPISTKSLIERGQSPQLALQQIPVLQSLVQLASRLDQIGQAAFLREFFEQNRGSCTFDWSQSLSTTRCFYDLDRQIGRSLETARRTRGSSPSRPRARPSCSHQAQVGQKRGILWYGDKPARKVATQAWRLRKVLDCFEEAGWPDRIDNPLADPHTHVGESEALHETLSCLREGLAYINFRADGSGKGIIWEGEESD